jgi:hypothetical protein
VDCIDLLHQLFGYDCLVLFSKEPLCLLGVALPSYAIRNGASHGGGIWVIHVTAGSPCARLLVSRLRLPRISGMVLGPNASLSERFDALAIL